MSAPAVAKAASAAAVPGSPLTRVVSIQHLRAAAALAVVIFHVLEASRTRFPVGQAGVDVFFVISGFIMWTLAAARPQTPGGFLLRRLLRIAPPYWIATLATAVLAGLKPNLWSWVEATPQTLLKSLAFVPYARRDGLIAPVLMQGWTLTYEVFFYLVFAAALFAPARRRLVLTTLILAALVALYPLVRGPAPMLRSLTNPLLLEFAAGLWIAQAFRAGRLPGPRAGAGLIAGALVLFACEQAVGLQPGTWRVAFWGAPAAALVTGALCLERAGVWRDTAALRFLGDSSYSLYLTHELVLVACAALLLRHGFALYAAAAVPAAIVFGGAFYLGVERPVHLWAANLTRRARPRAAAFAARS